MYKYPKKRSTAAYKPIEGSFETNNSKPQLGSEVVRKPKETKIEIKYQCKIKLHSDINNIDQLTTGVWSIIQTKNEKAIIISRRSYSTSDDGNTLITAVCSINERKDLYHDMHRGANHGIRYQIYPTIESSEHINAEFVPVKLAIQPEARLLGWATKGYYYHFIDGKLAKEYKPLGGDRWALQLTQSRGDTITDTLVSDQHYTSILLPYKIEGETVNYQHLLYQLKKISPNELRQITRSWLDRNALKLDVSSIVSMRKNSLLPRSNGNVSNQADLIQSTSSMESPIKEFHCAHLLGDTWGIYGEFRLNEIAVNIAQDNTVSSNVPVLNPTRNYWPYETGKIHIEGGVENEIRAIAIGVENRDGCTYTLHKDAYQKELFGVYLNSAPSNSPIISVSVDHHSSAYTGLKNNTIIKNARGVDNPNITNSVQFAIPETATRRGDLNNDNINLINIQKSLQSSLRSLFFNETHNSTIKLDNFIRLLNKKLYKYNCCAKISDNELGTNEPNEFNDGMGLRQPKIDEYEFSKKVTPRSLILIKASNRENNHYQYTFTSALSAVLHDNDEDNLARKLHGRKVLQSKRYKRLKQATEYGVAIANQINPEKNHTPLLVGFLTLLINELTIYDYKGNVKNSRLFFLKTNNFYTIANKGLPSSDFKILLGVSKLNKLSDAFVQLKSYIYKVLSQVKQTEKSFWGECLFVKPGKVEGKLRKDVYSYLTGSNRDDDLKLDLFEDVDIEELNPIGLDYSFHGVVLETRKEDFVRPTIVETCDCLVNFLTDKTTPYK